MFIEGVEIVEASVCVIRGGSRGRGGCTDTDGGGGSVVYWLIVVYLQMSRRPLHRDLSA